MVSSNQGTCDPSIQSPGAIWHKAEVVQGDREDHPGEATRTEKRGCMLWHYEGCEEGNLTLQQRWGKPTRARALRGLVLAPV